MSSKNNVTLIFFFALSYFRVSAQGCSDAGFCTLGDLKNHVATPSVSTETEQPPKNSIAVGFGYGLGFKNTNSFNAYLEYGRKLGKGFGVQLKATAAHTFGFLGENTALGDVFLVGLYNKTINDNIDFSAIVASKFPLSNANAKSSGGRVSLPLDYQASLGTIDGILGSSFLIKKHLEVSVGVQIPVFNLNESTFSPELYADTTVRDFVPTIGFVRKSDALLRVGYVFNFAKSRFSLKPNLLMIYHFDSDEYRLLGESENKVISGSKGTTLNMGVLFSYNFKNKSQLEMVLASPLIVRDVRPDGLTRSLVANLQYKVLF